MATAYNSNRAYANQRTRGYQGVYGSVDGTAARVLEPEYAPPPRRDARPEEKQRANARPHVLGKLVLFAAASVVLFSVFVGLITRDARIARLSADIYDLNKQIQTAETAYETLRVKLAEYEDIGQIMDQALALGMGYPQADQIIRIALPDEPEDQAGDSSGDSDQARDHRLLSFFKRLIGLLD